MPCRSEPAAGSLMAMAPIVSPVASFGRYFLLFLGAVVQDVRRDDLAVQAVTDAGDAGARQLLELHHRIQLVGVGAAIGLGHGGAEKPFSPALFPDRRAT